MSNCHYCDIESDYNFTCPGCKRYFCKNCLLQRLIDIAKDYKKNVTDFHYIPEGIYKCPCCEYNFSNTFLYSKFKDDAYYLLYLVDTSKTCIKCNKTNYNIFCCYYCKKYECLDCICEEQKTRIANHPEIKNYTEIPCVNCGKVLILANKLCDYLDDEICKKLLIETFIEKYYRENSKKCPKCGEIIFKSGDTYVLCSKCKTIFNWDNLKVYISYFNY